MSDVHVAIISSGRPGNVPAMTELCKPYVPTWYVGDGDAGDYRYAGAARVLEVGWLCESRNAALDAAALLGQPCLQLSDDLRALSVAHGPARHQVERITLPDAVQLLQDALATTGAHLAGAAPTANPYFAKARIHPSAFIVGDLMLVAADCPLRFNEAMRLKEDYDYTCRHLHRYGKVARVDWLLATFTHRTNRGGAVAFRTPEAEQRAIAQLRDAWPGVFKDNPKRPNEVLMRWPQGRLV